MMIPAALLLATLADAPTVRVDIDALAIPQAEAERLHGELMTRLVEAGHPVGSPAVVSVRLVGDGNDLHVEVQHGSRALVRDVQGKGAVLRLAAIHAVLDLLTELEKDAAWIDPDIAPPRDRFVLVNAEAGAEHWLGDVLRVLTQSGHVATSDPNDAAWRVCLTSGDDGRPAVAAARAAGECPPGESRHDLQEAVLGALNDARGNEIVTEPDDDLATPIDGAPHDRPPRSPTGPQAAPHTPSQRFSGALGAGVGAQGRLREPEPLLLVHGDARHARGGLLTMRVELAPSGGDNIGALDTWLTAGGGFAFTPMTKLRIELAATLGVALHGYWVGDDRGTRADIAAAVPVTLAGRLGRRIELGAQLVGGWSLRRRTHRIGVTQEWTRDAWRIGGLVVFRIVLGRETSRAAIR